MVGWDVSKRFVEGSLIRAGLSLGDNDGLLYSKTHMEAHIHIDIRAAAAVINLKLAPILRIQRLIRITNNLNIIHTLSTLR